MKARKDENKMRYKEKESKKETIQYYDSQIRTLLLG
jgi:hypothetical protein